MVLVFAVAHLLWIAAGETLLVPSRDSQTGSDLVDCQARTYGSADKAKGRGDGSLSIARLHSPCWVHSLIFFRLNFRRNVIGRLSGFLLFHVSNNNMITFLLNLWLNFWLNLPMAVSTFMAVSTPVTMGVSGEISLSHFSHDASSIAVTCCLPESRELNGKFF